MRFAIGLATLLFPASAALAVVAFSNASAAAGDVPSYTQPGGTGVTTGDDVKLTARDVTARLFKAAPGSRPDLQELNLARLDLAELDFKSADLDGADLYGTDLSRAKLAGASFVGARLDSTTITATDFSGADLTDARILRPTVFTTLEVAASEAPKFTGAKLVRFRSDGWLERADFSGADLTDAILGRSAVREPSVNAPASLSSANFTRAILKDAKLSGTSIKYASFVGADLSGANLRGADLTHANFSGANVAGADFTGANLDEADLRGARGLDQAIGLASATNYDRAQRDPVP
ncbi:pentapeptide repeat-containing protein [uncultured Hyphomicrobium sp.]|uniref:pentapeptide repeat-containing protein n=1 Tax=uncultured Hyphomicrobium sp. TaxID=194373 RepID=UPI0025CC7313|nr:pentapeptide repeat-containing protein [uncultured Hyphomicrobium sp.]